MSYYEVAKTISSNTTVTVYANFEQIRPAVRYGFEVDGDCVVNLDIRVLPFAVGNPTSKAELHCVLVHFSKGEEFAFAVYVCVNDGNVSLDFREAATDGYMFIVSESRYPYLTPQECRKQGEVYVKYFSRESERCKQRGKKDVKTSKNTSHVEEVKVEVPGL